MPSLTVANFQRRCNYWDDSKRMIDISKKITEEHLKSPELKKLWHKMCVDVDDISIYGIQKKINEIAGVKKQPAKSIAKEEKKLATKAAKKPAVKKEKPAAKMKAGDMDMAMFKKFQEFQALMAKSA